MASRRGKVVEYEVGAISRLRKIIGLFYIISSIS